MQLSNVRITNFRTIEDVAIDPGKVNVITGANGSGKSSTLEAISFLLTGKAGTNAVREGATCAEVSGDLMGSPIYRKIGSKATVKMNGKATTQKSVQQWIETGSGITMDTIRIATSSGMLASMNGKEFAEYLINNNLIPVEIDMTTLKMFCSISPEAELELGFYLPPDPCKFTAEDIQDAYAQIYAKRPILKKEIAEKTILANFTGMEPVHTLAEIDDELARYANYAATVSTYNKLMQSYMDAKRRRENVQQQIAEVEAKIKSSTAKPVDENEYTFLKQQEEKINQSIMQTTQNIRTIEANLAMFRRTLDNLDKPVCPISEKLICTTDKTEIKEDITTLIGENETMLANANAELAANREKLAGIKSKLSDYEARSKAYRDLQSLYSQRSALLLGVPELPEKPEKPKEIPNAEDAVKALKEERELIFKKEASVKAAKELPALEKQLALYDELIDLLCPRGGIREKIIETAFEPLVDHCNERAADLKADFKIGLVSDEGVYITCKPAGVSEMLPLSAVSSGEQLLAMLLILDAINSLSNLGILILDDLDKLDASSLDALFTMLENPEITDPYDHIFVAMVNHEDSLQIINKHKGIISNHIAL